MLLGTRLPTSTIRGGQLVRRSRFAPGRLNGLKRGLRRVAVGFVIRRGQCVLEIHLCPGGRHAGVRRKQRRLLANAAFFFARVSDVPGCRKVAGPQAQADLALLAVHADDHGADGTP